MVGDRRTAALVSADGTVDWLCLPDYDDAVVFGALLGAERGGFCRLGPAAAALGRQRYAPDTGVLLTTWSTPGSELELADAMAWPWDDRGEADGGGDAGALLRRLRCLRGEADCALAARPRDDFDRAPVVSPLLGGALFALGAAQLRLWADRAVGIDAEGAAATFRLRAGDEAWCVLATGQPAPCSKPSPLASRGTRELSQAAWRWRDPSSVGTTGKSRDDRPTAE